MVAFNVMTLGQYRDELIRRGIESVKQVERRPNFIAGGLAGFELCRSLVTLEDYERVLAERHEEERRRRDATLGGDDTVDAYWEYRVGTAQVEFMQARILVAYVVNGWCPERPISARAGIDYGNIVGVDGKLQNE